MDFASTPHDETFGRRWSETYDDRRATLARLENLSVMLDSAYRVPVLGIRVGIDPILGLLPVVGDIAGAALSSYLIYEARRLGVPRRVIARMIGNVAVEAVVGAVPVAGDLFDVVWKANRRNMRLLNEHLGRS